MPSAPMDMPALRIRLEGRLELLESALPKLERLRKTLGSLRWRREIAGERALARKLEAEHRAVLEACAEIDRLAAAEGWPARAHARVAAQSTRAEIDRLLELLAVRLPQLGVLSIPHELGACLRALCLQLEPAPQSERVVWQGPAPARVRPLLLVGSVLGSAYLVGFSTAARLPEATPFAVAAVVNLAAVLWSTARGVRYTVTTHRLLAASPLRPLSVPLTAARARDPDDPLTASLLRLLQVSPFRDGLGPAHGVLARACRSEDRQLGAALLLEEGLLFLPDGGAAFGALGAAGTPRDTSALVVLSAVRCLPEVERARLVRTLRALEGCVLVPRSAVRLSVRCLIADAPHIEANLDEAQLDGARRLLAGSAALPVTPAGRWRSGAA